MYPSREYSPWYDSTLFIICSISKAAVSASGAPAFFDSFLADTATFRENAARRAALAAREDLISSLNSARMARASA